jgi:thiamine biosynthesis protein ThiI
MMHTCTILAHYAEIATKGKNRPLFVKRLARNIAQALEGLPLKNVRILPGRLWIQAKEGHFWDAEALKRLSHVYGLANFAPAVKVELSHEAIAKQAWALLEHRTYNTFRISARRAFKDLPFPSMELNRTVGAYVLQQRPCKVVMKNAEAEVHIEVMPDGAYVYAEKFQGPGGLPVGMSGTGCCLLSGGIDSPVAAARMQKRGLRLVFVHFHSHPYHTRASQEKAHDLAQVLARAQQKALVYNVPFGDIQREIVDQAPASLRVVLYRRCMVRIAERIAQETHAKALVTGESLGQVASQTLENMGVINAVAQMPVLRPLVGHDKSEIVEAAMRIGTYGISILPDQDCCTLFIPRNPETKARLHDVEKAESGLNIEALITDALARTEKQVVMPSWAQ